MSAGERIGLESRYYVKRLNDAAHKHDDCEFFVLDPAHDPQAAKALRTYAGAVGEPLARDIHEWLRSLGYCPHCTQVKGHRGRCA